jgi:hypothetical protein
MSADFHFIKASLLSVHSCRVICLQGDDIFLDMFEAEYRQMKVSLLAMSQMFEEKQELFIQC